MSKQSIEHLGEAGKEIDGNVKELHRLIEKKPKLF